MTALFEPLEPRRSEAALTRPARATVATKMPAPNAKAIILSFSCCPPFQAPHAPQKMERLTKLTLVQHMDTRGQRDYKRQYSLARI